MKTRAFSILISSLVILGVAGLAFFFYSFQLSRDLTEAEKEIERLHQSVEEYQLQTTDLEKEIDQSERRFRINSKTAHYRKDDGQWVELIAGADISSDLLTSLPTDLESVRITLSSDGLYLVVGSKIVEGALNDRILSTASVLMPLSSQQSFDDEVSEWQFYVWSPGLDREFVVNEKSKLYKANVLTPIASLYWQSLFGGCFMDFDRKSGAYEFSCGHGDNGCSIFEYTQMSIFDGSVTSLGMCSNDCDVGVGARAYNECASGVVEEAWNK